jgi:nucleotide-binding universal stress UspA family protein
MSWTLLIIGCIWMLFGVVYGIAMGRRGYDWWSWAILGAIFGPLVIPLAISLRRRRDQSDELRWEPARERAGVRVLVGIDGSTEAVDAARRVVDMFGERLGAIFLAVVIDYDAARELDRKNGQVFERDAQRWLKEAEAAVGIPCGHLLMTGPPASSLLDAARKHSVDLIAVGPRGNGLSEKLLGSTAEHLTRQAVVPVLVVRNASVPTS